jgi:hypothetical protein
VQDLAEVLVKPHRGAQDLRVLRGQQSKPRRLVEHARSRGVQYPGNRMSVGKLEILGDKFEIDEAARGVFEVPAPGIALFGRDRPAHFDHVGGDRRGVARSA